MFNRRKNKSFNYTSRFSDTEKSKTTSSSVPRAFENKRKPKASTIPVLLIVLGLVIALMYYLETKLR